MSVGERIKILRKDYLKLSQTEFGEPLGLTYSAIGGYEKEIRGVSDATILSICREYGVREEWLRNGTGDVFTASAPSLISDIAQEFNLDSMDQAIISEYLKLDKQSRAILKNYVRSVFLASREDLAIDREVESYREELLEEKREKEESSPSGTTSEKRA